MYFPQALKMAIYRRKNLGFFSYSFKIMSNMITFNHEGSHN